LLDTPAVDKGTKGKSYVFVYIGQRRGWRGQPPHNVRT